MYYRDSGSTLRTTSGSIVRESTPRHRLPPDRFNLYPLPFQHKSVNLAWTLEWCRKNKGAHCTCV